MKNKLVVFDFDGVIVDSMQLGYSINKGMMPDLEYKEWESWFEGNIYQKIRKEHANDNSQDIFFEKYIEGIVNILPVEGMTDVVRELAKKYTLVIISSSTEKSIRTYLEKHGLIDYFQDILGRETHRAKVDKFHLILEKYQIKADETLMITDTIGDIREANEVGVRSLGVIWGVHNAGRLKEANPHFIATKPSEIVAGVDSILGL